MTPKDSLNLAGKKITVVIDPSHKDWVLGGMFQEVIETSPEFFELEIQVVHPPRGIKSLVHWIKASLRLRRKQYLLFTSLTPLQNFLKSNLARRNQKIAIWYTHKVGSFTKSESRALKRVNVIFAHSARDFVSLKSFTASEMVTVIGAIDAERFARPSEPGPGIAWIGTPVERKQPRMLLDLADSIPNQKFRLIGRGWKESIYWSEVIERKNISYVELEGALKTEILDGCSIYLVTSNCEGGPMPLLESLASGLHPIATDVGFVREVFDLAGVNNKFIVEARVENFLKAIESASKHHLNGQDLRREAVLSLTMRRMALILHQHMCIKDAEC